MTSNLILVASCKDLSTKTRQPQFNRWVNPSTQARETISSYFGTVMCQSCFDKKISSVKSLSSICRSTSLYTQPSWALRTNNSETESLDENSTNSKSTLTQEAKICLERANFCSSTLFRTFKIRFSTPLSRHFAQRNGLQSSVTSLKNSWSSTCPRISHHRYSIGTQTTRRSNSEAKWARICLQTQRKSKRSLC